MKLLCREDHDSQLCPSGPEHDFIDGGWTTEENGIGCFWCRRCGSVRQLLPANIRAPDLEMIEAARRAAE